MAGSAVTEIPQDVSETSGGQEQATQNYPATASLPAVVTPKAEVILAQPHEQSDHGPWYGSPEWWLVLVTVALAFYTARLFRATVQLGRDAKQSAEGQAERMQASVEQSVRSASATESIAEATRANAALMQEMMKRQMRAYVSVDIGTTIYQDDKLRFESDPVLHNTGFTPARKVTYRVMADILDGKLPENYQFADDGKRVVNDISLSPRQTFVIHGIVRDRFEEKEVAEILKGEARRLYVWGSVSYEDIYGGKWETQFCHHFSFFPDAEGKMRVNGYFHRSHNAAT